MTELGAAPRKRPRPKYQVFISSTYVDLHEERRELTWEVLKSRHIPAGMENFTATDDRGWRTIQRTIDLSDYYVLLIAGKYGSIDPTTGMSWTEREYRYARSKGMRVLAFIREDGHITADKLEKDADLGRRLDELKSELRGNHLCEKWGRADDLKSKVMHALQHQIAEDEDGNEPRPGWYRGDEVGASPAVLEEFARLSAENDRLKRQLGDFERGTAEELVLLQHDGAPLEPIEVLADLARVRAGSGKGPAPIYLESGYQSSKEEALIVWLRLRVQNTGRGPARNVVADFNAARTAAVYAHTRDLHVLDEVPFYFNPTEHVYVETSNVEQGVGTFRQRIRQVAAGGYEHIVRMGFVVETQANGEEDIPLSINYAVRSEDGASCAGAIQAAIRVKDMRSRAKA